MGAPGAPAESPAPAAEVAPDYEKLYEDVKAKPCRVDRIDRAYEATGRKPLRTRSTIIDRELEVGAGATTVRVLIAQIYPLALMAQAKA